MSKHREKGPGFPKVSIVFVNWNGKKYTFDLLDSLKKVNYPNYDVIVVDNGSSEDIEKDFNKKYKKFATLIKNDKNLGLAEGTNVGIREALKRNSKYVLTMNNDMYVDKKFLMILVDRMEKHPKVAVSGPKIYYANPDNLIWSAGCDYHIWGFKSRHQNEIDKGNVEKDEIVDGLDCVLMMRGDLLKKYGLLEKDFFIMDEFTELCLRVTRDGWKCLFVPGSKVWHKVSASMESNTGNKMSVYYWSRNWLLDVKKNKGFPYFIMVLILQSTIFALYRWIKHLKHGKFFLMKFYFEGIFDAILNHTGKKRFN